MSINYRGWILKYERRVWWAILETVSVRSPAKIVLPYRGGFATIEEARRAVDCQTEAPDRRYRR